MGIFKRLTTLTQSLATPTSPSGFALGATAGFINRIEHELKSGSSEIEAFLACFGGYQKWLDYNDMAKIEELSFSVIARKLGFFEYCIQINIQLWSNSKNMDQFYAIRQAEAHKIVQGTLKAIEKHWDDTFYVKRNYLMQFDPESKNI